MQEAVQRYAEGVRRDDGRRVQIRVGLNSGEVVVRAIGSDLHMDYTAVGQTTHLAARMEQMARARARSSLTAATLRLVEGFVEVKPLGPRAGQGAGRAGGGVRAGRARAPVRSRLQAAAARGLTRFVGRDGEIEQLRHALERGPARPRPGRGARRASPGWASRGSSGSSPTPPRPQGWLVLESALRLVRQGHAPTCR